MKTFKMIESKECTKCGALKPLSEFSKNKAKKFGVDSWCKSCCKEYKQANKDVIKEYNKEYYQNNKETIKKYKKEYYQSNKEAFKERNKEYYQSNKKAFNKWYKNRIEVDPLFKVKENVRKLIYNSLKAKNYTKKSRTHKLLGASYKTVMNHLIQTAINNYGFYDENEDYHIDHIVPCASATNEEEMLKLQHYTNLQFLKAEDNLKKGARIDFELNSVINLQKDVI